MRIISNSNDETRKIAEEFVRSLKAGERAVVVALEGDLGSGKTTFSQFIGETLGVHDPIQSPTFLIEKIYELRKKPWEHLIHIDAYRLDSPQELLDLGWREIVKRPGNLVLVEWADKVGEILPEDAIHIGIKHVDENTREFEIQDQ
ncbi:tRNA (adenosine(37)-N6)-threonylcarbamoyltransferase complex ATPase subunit type 1 TsaE [Candidatus Parcubacteria bacterium]|nr:tRNA (adenosine(37)-N6)-threonylcarbamoyltransferase complex ATPase subunit type 1 TsaE [Candidatus Parcubacteria bacterium]